MSLFPFFRKISTMASKLLQDDGEMFMDRIQNDRDIKRPKRKKVGFWPEETDFIITWLKKQLKNIPAFNYELNFEEFWERCLITFSLLPSNEKR